MLSPTVLRVLSVALFIISLAFLSWQLFTPAPEVKVGDYDKLYHATGFAWLGLTAYIATIGIVQYWPKVVIALCLYAVATEIVQYFIPGRSYSTLDWLADWSGVVIFAPLIVLVIRKLLNLVR